MRSTLFAPVLAAASLLAALATPPALAATPCKRQALEVPVELVDYRPIVTLTVAGQELRMLLDTGAFFSSLKTSTATELGLPLKRAPAGLQVEGYAGAIDYQVTKVDEVNFHGLPLKNVEFLVGGNELGLGIRGILGRNFLGLTDMEYDLAQGMVRLIFLKGDCEEVHPVYWANDVPVIEADLEGGPRDKTLRVDVKVNNKRFNAILDTGAFASILNLSAARRAGMERDSFKELGRIGGGGEGSLRVWTAPLRSFELGGQKVSELNIKVSEAHSRDFDLILGLDYFLSHRIYVSYRQRKLYATWNGGPIFSQGAVNRTEDAQQGAARNEAVPTDAAGLVRVASAAATRGDTATALQHLDRAVALAPESPDVRLARARVLNTARRGEATLRDLDEALHLSPELHAARLLRAQIRTTLKQRTAAVDDLQELDRRLPQTAEPRRDMANLYAHLDHLPEALRQWELWMAPRPKDADRLQVLNARCWLRARLSQQLEAALKDCQAAIEGDEENPAFRDSLGWLQLRRNQPEEALKAFNQALKRKPDHAWALVGRSLSQRQRGEATAAQQDWAAALAANARIPEEVQNAGFGDLLERHSAP
ncbi:retropepsin-like aspartic protease [Inhella gelatinilytica]|uniref:Aspartyl protease family protein n=1 Tax=Inhella gelatinilytica TaxID=2795030 RepID=A0A931IV49_9BURK|nr:retropepsin-like aspartic protease [Inhella gelatinilytica]MBH9551564.1 aspartyl protease family protein [Inhella gelatinilytica]